MPELANPHDKFFKEALTQPDAAREFLRYYLPAEVATLLDLSNLRLVKDSFVDETLQEHFSDLLYEVRLLDGRDAYVYVLFEHKSYADPLVAFQVLRYMVRVWDYGLRQRGQLWPILPVVVYHGAARWPVAVDFHALFDLPEAVKPFVPDYRYWLCDLTAYSDAELQGAVALRVALLTLKHILREDVHERLPDVLALWRILAQQKTGLGYLEAILRYLVTGTDKLTERELWETLAAVAPEGEELMSTIAQHWIEVGEQRGERKGLLDGITLGLELRWGAEGLRLLPEIGRIEDVYLLRAIHEGLKRVSTPEELRRIYQAMN